MLPEDDTEDTGSDAVPLPADPATPEPTVWVENDRVMMRTPVPDSIRDLVPGASDYLIALDLDTGRAVLNLLDEAANPVFLVSLAPGSQAYADAPLSATSHFSAEAVADCLDLPCLPAATLAGPEADHMELGSWATILAVSGSLDGIFFENAVALDPEGLPTTMNPSGGPLDLSQQDRLNILGEVLLDVSEYSPLLAAAAEEAIPTGGNWGCEFGRYAALGGLGILWGACCVATIETVAGCVLCTAGAGAAGDAVKDYDCGG